MLEINEELFKAKNGGEYSRNDISNDFAIPGEITVTITLNEYRALISANAISEKKISDLNSERYDAQAETGERETSERNRRAESQNFRPAYGKEHASPG